MDFEEKEMPYELFEFNFRVTTSGKCMMINMYVEKAKRRSAKSRSRSGIQGEVIMKDCSHRRNILKFSNFVMMILIMKTICQYLLLIHN